MALIINSTLLRLAAYIENELGRGDSTPRDDTLLKLAVTTLRPEIIKGITIDSVVDTLDEASVCAQTSAMCIFGLRGLQNRMKVAPLLVIEEPLDCRADRIFQEYIMLQWKQYDFYFKKLQA